MKSHKYHRWLWEGSWGGHCLPPRALVVMAALPWPGDGRVHWWHWLQPRYMWELVCEPKRFLWMGGLGSTGHGAERAWSPRGRAADLHLPLSMGTPDRMRAWVHIVGEDLHHIGKGEDVCNLFYWSIVELHIVSISKWFSCTYINIVFYILHSQDIEYSSLWYIVGPCCLSIL